MIDVYHAVFEEFIISIGDVTLYFGTMLGYTWWDVAVHNPLIAC